MRIDKFLKVSRIIKRRVIAKEAAQKDKVEINGRMAKPSSLVAIGDELTLYLGQKIIKIKVLALTSQKDVLMYELLSEEKRP